ncbi:syndecan-4 isoform X2 [Cololabis saira]|uniref:syndecan-4 isoform X2 n=1 Tax=Cololabis saira TaxID=129043 RepID=UPI002AD46699|nr:syndecan-4 isoform X2 [Cololabis saira]
MIRLSLAFLLAASVCAESVREMETWMPMKTTQTVAMATRHDGDLEASGDAPNSSDFAFRDDEDDEDDYEFSGSGEGESTASPAAESRPTEKSDVNDIPEPERPVRPTATGDGGDNDILRVEEPVEEMPSNVLMSHAGDESIFNKTEVLAALIAGGVVGLVFAVLLILLLVYRMKKKDEGSYDLGKKPIYKKAPTTEIYA